MVEDDASADGGSEVGHRLGLYPTLTGCFIDDGQLPWVGTLYQASHLHHKLALPWAGAPSRAHAPVWASALTGRAPAVR
jgi:hypothetical protein